MLEVETGVEAIKSRGLRVIRAVIPSTSKLIGTTASETNFRQAYKAAIVAVQRGKQSVSNKLSQARFEVGDLVVLQASDDSPLLIPPPKDFYRNISKGDKKSSSLSRFRKRISSFGSLSDAASVKSENESDTESPGKLSRAADEESQTSANAIDEADAQSVTSSVGEASQKSEVSALTVDAKNFVLISYPKI